MARRHDSRRCLSTYRGPTRCLSITFPASVCRCDKHRCRLVTRAAGYVEIELASEPFRGARRVDTENGNAVDWSEVAAQFGERFDTGVAVRQHHGRAETSYPMLPPYPVAFPRTTEEVAAAVRFR